MNSATNERCSVCHVVFRCSVHVFGKSARALSRSHFVSSSNLRSKSIAGLSYREEEF